MSPDNTQVLRGFVSIREGQVHYRHAGQQHPGKPPLVMFHASPGSAKTLEPLIQRMARHRHVIALDTLGNGDSCAPQSDAPDLGDFADAHLRALTALNVERFDAWGAHTGANIACDLAIEHPERVRSVIMDGIGLYPPEEQAELLQRYLPHVQLDTQGSQITQLWNFVRDAYLFWPWYRQDSAHRRPGGLPDAHSLHDKAVEVFKAARTFHLSYRAALAYPKQERLPLIRVPTFITCAQHDMLFKYFEAVCTLVQPTQSAVTPGTGTAEALETSAQLFEQFLDAR